LTRLLGIGTGSNKKNVGTFNQELFIINQEIKYEEGGTLWEKLMQRIEVQYQAGSLSLDMQSSIRAQR